MSNDIGNRAAGRIPLFRSRRTRFLIPGLAFALCIVAGTLPPVGATGAGQASDQTDVHRFEGRWVRPDGGYVLDLQRIDRDGRVQASYFTPRRIDIARAELRLRSNGTIRLFVELRDANQSGSTYDLLYSPKTDSFIGTYFQAVQKQTYNVEFVRTK